MKASRWASAAGVRNALVALCAWFGSAAVLAGPLAVRGPDGTRWRINDDDEPALLERLAPNGALDTTFGRNGRVTLDFGGTNANISALRVDTTGRIWLAATAIGASSTPLVQRLLPTGQPDGSWGAGGRSIATPAGQRLMVVDLLPQPDGSAWVSANLFGPQGENDAGLWHLKPNGTLDYGFGLGGLWKRPGGERSRALTLADGPDGSIALGLEVLTGREPGREVYLVKPGERQQPQAVPAPGGNPDDDEEDEVYLLWDGARWRWRPGPQVAELAGLPVLSIGAAAPPAAASGPAEAGHIALNPFSEPVTTVDASDVVTEDDTGWPWGWLIGLSAGLAAAIWWLRRRAQGSRADGGRTGTSR